MSKDRFSVTENQFYQSLSMFLQCSLLPSKYQNPPSPLLSPNRQSRGPGFHLNRNIMSQSGILQKFVLTGILIHQLALQGNGRSIRINNKEIRITKDCHNPRSVSKTSISGDSVSGQHGIANVRMGENFFQNTRIWQKIWEKFDEVDDTTVILNALESVSSTP